MVSKSLGSTLLGRAREAVIGVLFTSPAPLHQREIVRRSGIALAPVQRELSTLVSLGLVVEEPVGNLKAYRPNPASPLFHELTGIAVKTFGIGGRLKAGLERVKGVDSAFVFGSIAGGGDTATSDIDLLVVGTAGYSALALAARNVSEAVGRHVSAKLYRPDELRGKVVQGNEFLRGVIDGPKIFVIGNEETLNELIAAQGTRARQGAKPQGPRKAPERGGKPHRARRGASG